MSVRPQADLSSGPVSGAARAVLPALAAAASRTGVDFTALYKTARLESGFNPTAKARTSSATGLFQFIDSSWLNMLSRHGARHGLAPASRAEALALRNDPAAASLMAAEHMADNARLLESRLGREAGPTDLYLAHFLGPGGAIRFLQALQAAPDQAAAMLLPAAARANRVIFFDAGQPRSLSEVHQLLAGRMESAESPAGYQVTAIRPSGPATQPSGTGTGPVEVAGGLSRDGAAGQAGGAVQMARLAYLLLADMGA